MDLNIDYEALASLSTQVSSKGEEFQDLLNKIKNINEDLKTYWEGTDAAAYSKAVEDQAQYMQKLSDTIKEISAFLAKVNAAYKEACENNAAAAGK